MKTIKKFKLFLPSVIFAFASVMISCSDDEGPTVPVDVKDNIITSQTDVDLDPIALTGNVVADITLTSDKEWILSGPLSVKDGFTLTIEPGTTIKANAGGTNVYIVIEQGAKIDAVGTASAPIRITSGADNPRAGDWGGLIINGYAKISGGGTSTTEVLPLTYGGTDDTDDSGDIAYMVLEYTGARINGEKEFNGLTLYGVGNGTSINNIVINKGDDDTIEFFGGTVQVNNLLVIDARDDLFDWTQGWRSINGQSSSNWYGVRTADFTSISEDTRGIEADGNLDGNSPTDGDQSNPTITNVTIINSGIIEMADMVKLRRGTSATITGLYLAFSGGDATAADTIDCTDTKGDAVAGTSVSGTVNVTSGVDIEDIKVGANSATVTLTASTTPSVDIASFAWAGITL